MLQLDLTQELYSVSHIRAIEKAATEEAGISSKVLMQRAAKEALASMSDNFSGVTTITVVVGKGNNGGDGLVFAYLAHKANYQVKVICTHALSELSPLAAKAYKKCEEAKISLFLWSEIKNSEEHLDADVIVDALLGIGLKDAPQGVIKTAINAINEYAQGIVFALDVPSGLDADTGGAPGEAIRADLTCTFIGMKQGLVTGKGLALSGKIEVADLALPPSLFSLHLATAVRADFHHLEFLLAPRELDAHKGDFGHIVIVGGNYGMAGAVRLAGEAALRAGAGLVSVITRPEHVAAVVGNCPELMCYGVDDPKEHTHLLKCANVIAIGPGLNEDEWSKKLLQWVLESKKPLVIDAGALNILAQNTISKKPTTRDPKWILTPHPGEAARLLKTTTAAIQANRYQAAKDLQTHWQSLIVLKGAGTLIQSPHRIPAVCPYGNPGMAVPGMGDLLTGIIAALWGQGLPAHLAAELGVVAHALAGDLAVKSGERGMRSSDLFPYLREILNSFSKSHGSACEDELCDHEHA